MLGSAVSSLMFGGKESTPNPYQLTSKTPKSIAPSLTTPYSARLDAYALIHIEHAYRTHDRINLDFCLNWCRNKTHHSSFGLSQPPLNTKRYEDNTISSKDYALLGLSRPPRSLRPSVRLSMYKHFSK